MLLDPTPDRLHACLQDLCDRSGLGSGDFVSLTSAYSQQFAGAASILIATPDPTQFLAALLAGMAANCWVFLGNPRWQQREWQQVFTLVRPEICIGPVPEPMPTVAEASIPPELTPGIAIPTGGSSGQIRFAMHDRATLRASVAGVYEYFDCRSLHSYCVLPLYHVSGLMQFLRALWTGGRFIIRPYPALKQAFAAAGGEMAAEPVERSQFLISLVPTQLQQLLDLGASSWLREFRVVLLGGAPPWPTLVERARREDIPLGLTYGSTETASQVATLKPAEFRQGNDSSGRILPHARVRIAADRPGAVGPIGIAAPSLFRGYYPEERPDRQWFWTDDLGWQDRQGYLHVCGRTSRKIVTGGENVMPEEVEAAILATGAVADVCVVGIPDCRWGEAIVALYRADRAIEPETIGACLQLAHYKHPKIWLAVPEVPRNDRGKADLAACKAMAIARSKRDFPPAPSPP